MASKNIGSIFAELSLRDKDFSKGLKGAAGSIKKFGGIAIGAGVAAASAMAAALTAGTLRTLSMTDELVDLSNQSGFAIDDMMKLQQAYKDGGRSAEMAGKDIGKMQKNLVTASQGGNDPFKTIGLSAKELLKLNPADQFSAIGSAIMRIQNPAERTAKAMEIFGKGGMGLITVFEGMPAAEKALGRMPELAQRFGKAMGEANDLIGHLPLKSDQFFMGFTAGIIGELLPQLERIDNFDFTTLGENLGSSLVIGFSVLTDGTLVKLAEMEFVKLGLAVEDTFAKIFGDTAKLAENSGLREFINMQESGTLAGISARFGTSRGNAAGKGVAQPITAPQTVTIQAPEKMEVNEYQRRGLSLDGGGGGIVSEAKKQTSILGEVKELLRRNLALSPPATW